MPYPVKLDTDAVTDTFNTLSSGAKSAVRTPEEIAAFTKEFALAGGAAFKFFSVASTANDLKNIWFDDAESTKHSVLGKIGLSLVYSGHIAATAIGASAIFGAAVIAAPFAAAIVSGTALIKNIVDYVKEARHVRNLKGEVKSLEAELEKANIDFEKNLALHHDFENQHSKIHSLEDQSKTLETALQALSTAENDETTDNSLTTEKLNTYIAEEAQELSTALENKAQKNDILAKHYDPDKPPKNISATDHIKHSEDKAALFRAAKEQVLEELMNAKANNQLEKIDDLEMKVRVFDAKIEKHDILKSHYEKIQKIETQLSEVHAQIQQLDKKYSTEPYKSSEKAEGLKKLESEYLSLREQELTQQLKDKMDPQRRKSKADGLHASAEQLAPQGNQARMQELKSALKEHLQSQKAKVDNKIVSSKDNLKEKERFMALFATDPKKEIQGSAKELLKKSLKLLDKKAELKLAKLQRNKKAKEIGFAAAGLAIAACVCIPPLWPVAGILTLVGAAVGVVAGLSSLWDKYQKSKEEKAIKKEKNAEVSKIIAKIDEKTQKKKDKALEATVQQQAELHSKLASTLSHTPTSPQSNVQSTSITPTHNSVPTTATVLFSQGSTASSQKSGPSATTQEKKQALDTCKEIIGVLLANSNSDSAATLLKSEASFTIKRQLEYIQNNLASAGNSTAMLDAIKNLQNETKHIWKADQDPIQKLVNVLEGKEIKKNTTALINQLEHVKPAQKSSVSMRSSG